MFFLVIGCQSEQKPNIPEEKMVNIFVDIHLIEASLLGYSDEQKDSLSNVYYSQIYEIHGVSEDEFLKEMDYLKRHPDYLGGLYEKVLEEIDKRETELK